MAKRTKKKSSAKPEEVIDAVVTDDVTTEVSVDDAADVIVENNPVPEDVTPQDSAVAAPDDPQPEPVSDPVAETAPEPVYTDSSRENNVLLPMILGGLIAGGIGYGVAYMSRPVIDVPLDQQVAAHSDEIAALQASLETIPEGIDLSPLEEQIATSTEELNATVAGLDERIALLEERIDVVEKQPSGDGTLQDTAVAAFQRELDELRTQTDQMSADTAAALQATRDEASAIEQNAVENARKATARAALARVQGALESGAGFGDILTDLGDAIDAPIPAALAEASDGVPTLGQLQADFPAVARAALSTARAEGADGDEAGGFGSFLRSQLNVRSVTPQEGDGADAVLSRAEAALSEGRLDETLAEVATLPEVVRGTLSEWLTRAEQRSSALAAADELSQSLNVN